MTTIQILLLLVGLSAVFAQFEQCYDLVNGLNPESGQFSDPVFVNGQAFGTFWYNFTDINGKQRNSGNSYEGFSWPWKSRSYNSGNGGNTPALATDDGYGMFSVLSAPGFNGWEWNNNYDGGSNTNKEVRMCGNDNETFTDGPGVMMSSTSWWDILLPPAYNLTFWQKVYVPSAPTANWARVIHYVHNPGGKTLRMYYTASSYHNPSAIFINAGGSERFGIFSDIDQGRAIAYIPTTFNWMGKNARLRVSGSYSLDCTVYALTSEFDLAPGATVGFMSIYSQNMNISQATNTAKWVDTNPAELYAKLTDDDITSIVNWDACTTMFGSEVSIEVTQADKCSTSGAQIAISTTGTTLGGSITHRVLNADGEVVASNVTTSVTLTQAGSYVLESWWSGCIVKRTPFTAVINDASWNSNTRKINGSNGPFKFAASGSNTITVTDKNGCSFTGSFTMIGSPSTPGKKSNDGESVVPSFVLAIAGLAYLF